MKISSSAFENNQMIPKKYTCQGKDINPPLMITEIPSGTKTLALIVDDPDAPAGTWVHWVVFDIPVKGNELEIKESSIPGRQGRNDFGKQDYGGPCPPFGTHRYYFKAYALDERLDLSEKITTKKSLEAQMKNHILDQAELVGLYKK